MAAGLTMMSSCSDDDPSYAQDIFYTGSMDVVKVVSASGAGTLSTGSSAFNLDFTAVGGWTITTESVPGFDNATDWITFYQTSGDAGSQHIGAYVAANPGATDRAMLVRLNCNGQSTYMTVVQQGQSVTATPSSAQADPTKQITSIKKTYANGSVEDVEYTYTSNCLDGFVGTYTEKDASESKKTTATIDVTSRVAADKTTVGVNKVSYTVKDRNGDTSTAETVAVVNGVVAIGYYGTTVSETNNIAEQVQNYTYGANNYLSGITAANGSSTFTWSNGSLSKSEGNYGSASHSASMSYGTRANDTNLDLNAILMAEFNGNVSFDTCGILSMMNLMGQRSPYMLTSVNGYNVTYAEGLVDDEGEAKAGVVVTIRNSDGSLYATWEVAY